MKSLILFIILLSFTSVFPTWKHFYETPPGTTYSGWHGEFPDYYLYLSVIRQGNSFSSFTSTYTTEYTPQTRMYDFYLFLGFIGRWMPLSPAVLYHSALMMSTILQCIFVYNISRLFFSGYWHILSMGVIFFSSPFPSFTIPLIDAVIGTGGWTKMDIYSRISHVPHHSCALAMMLGALYMLLRYLQGRHYITLFLATVMLMISIWSFALPGLLYLVSLCLLILYVCIKKEYTHILPLFIVWMGGVSMMIYAWYQLSTAGWASWEYTHFRPETYPYLFSVFLSSYGVLLFGYIRYVIHIRQHLNAQNVFLSSMALVPIIGYGASVIGIVPITKIRFMYSAPYVFIGLCSLISLKYNKMSRMLTTIVVLVWIVCVGFDIRQNYIPKLDSLPPYQNVYIPDEYLQIAQYLDTHAPAFSGIMAPYEIASFLPAYTNNKVFAGHPYAFFQHPEKKDILERWYAGSLSEEEIKKIIQHEHIQYVVWKTSDPPVPAYETFFVSLIDTEKAILYTVK